MSKELKETILVVQFERLLDKKERAEWKRNLSGLIDFDSKVAIDFYDEPDEAVFAIEKRNVGDFVPYKDRNARMMINALLHGEELLPIRTRRVNWRFTSGYIEVYLEVNPPSGELTLARKIKGDVIKNMVWKETQERYVCLHEHEYKWLCIETPFEGMRLLRCIANNPYTGLLVERYILRPIESNPNGS